MEKGEVVKQNLEYELAKVNKELLAEHRLRIEHETASAETVENLQRTLILVLHVLTINQRMHRWYYNY